MRSRNLVSQLQRLHDLFNKVDVACVDDFAMRSHWAKYLCVLSAGFLEEAISEVYGEYATRSANKFVADYTNSVLSKIQNPNAQKFIETAKRFHKTWGEELELFLESNGRRDAIDSIMANRHQIAHGKVSGITLVRIREYLDKSVEVIAFIENQCGL